MSQAANQLNTDMHLSQLNEMREYDGTAVCTGLSDDVVQDFLDDGCELASAIQRAYEYFVMAQESHPEFLALDEESQVSRAQERYTNFYRQDAINPYVAAGAAGPWVVSLKGAVIYDCGGYGMLGLGHAPQAVLDAMNQPHVMANVMTSNISQMEFIASLRQEIGHNRTDAEPFASFLCLNSGSEATSAASRIADINTKNTQGS